MKAKLSQNDIFSFLLGFSVFLVSKSVGQVIYLEVTAIFFLIIRTIRKTMQRQGLAEFRLERDGKLLISFGFLWFLDQAFSNVYHHTEKLDQLLSLSQILVVLILVYWSLTWFQEDTKRILYFTIGYCFSILPTYFFVPTLYSRSFAWQFLFGPSITLIIFLKLSLGYFTPLFKLSVIVVLAGLDLLGGSRSLALITLLTATALLRRNAVKRRLSTAILLLLVIVGSLFFAENIYKDLALSGKIGQRQQIKAQLQYSSGPLLLVGRSEFLYELASLKENWLVGSGAKPKITTEILDQTAQFEVLAGVRHTSTAAYQVYTTTGLLPRHSMLFASWVEGGLVALFFWLLLSWKILRWVYLSNSSTGPFGLLSYYLAVNYFWALLFSPLGAGSRVSLAFSIGVIYHQFMVTQELEWIDE